MRSGRTLQTRLDKLEAVLNILPTDDKWAIVHQRALQLMSDRELEILEELASLEIVGGAIAQTHERVSAMARFEDAFWIAMSTAKVRFTIPEMDQLLVGA